MVETTTAYADLTLAQNAAPAAPAPSQVAVPASAGPQASSGPDLPPVAPPDALVAPRTVTVPEPFIPPTEARRIRPRSPRAALEPEWVRMPTRASKNARHPVVVAGNAVITTLLLAVIAGGIILGLVKNRLDAAGPLPADKIVNVPPRLGIRDIADLLVKEGVIEHPAIFIVMALPAKMRDQLKFGEYQFPRQASLHDVINTFVEGKWVQHPLTIAEGLTSEQIVQKVLEADFLTGNIKEIPREGSMLPETYRFTRSTPREKAIAQMQQAQQRVVKEIWDRRLADLPLRSMDQLVTLASIVEKETGRADERSRVAAVFVNRLKQKMKLQSDPTIIYGLVGGKGTLGRPIQRSEIEQPTPYNTYVIDGLPPGPIANPGRAALEAVANPARTKELYFVADGTGGHAFSETLDAHQRNVARLRALEQAQRETAMPAPVAQVPPLPAAPVPAAAPPAQPAAAQRRTAARASQQPQAQAQGQSQGQAR